MTPKVRHLEVGVQTELSTSPDCTLKDTEGSTTILLKKVSLPIQLDLSLDFDNILLSCFPSPPSMASKMSPNLLKKEMIDIFKDLSMASPDYVSSPSKTFTFNNSGTNV